MSDSLHIDGRRPLAIAASLFLLACSGVALFHPSLFGSLAGSLSTLGPLVLLVGLLPLIVSLAAWLRSAQRRGIEDSTGRVVGRQIAMLAFIASEVAFFAASVRCLPAICNLSRDRGPRILAAGPDAPCGPLGWPAS